MVFSKSKVLLVSSGQALLKFGVSCALAIDKRLDEIAKARMNFVIFR